MYVYTNRLLFQLPTLTVNIVSKSPLCNLWDASLQLLLRYEQISLHISYSLQQLQNWNLVHPIFNELNKFSIEFV